MGWESDAATAYENELRAAERHMDEPDAPEGGTCGQCSHCVTCCFDEVADGGIRDEMTARYGICIECPERPFVVPLAEWHAWSECWMGERDGAY